MEAVVTENRDAVRVAALRVLLRRIATPAGVDLSPTDEQAAKLVAAGYDLPDICAALAIPDEMAEAILIRLAR